MSFVLLVSSTGFSFNVHICQDQIETFSFFGEAPACEMAEKHKETKSCCALKKEEERLKKQEGQDVISALPCCNNQQLYYTLDVEYETSIEAAEKPDIQLNPAFVSNPSIELNSFDSFGSMYDIDPPPLIKRNISVLYQVFRL